MTLEEYRARHALYKLDPKLQRAHAAYPWVVTRNDLGSAWSVSLPHVAGRLDAYSTHASHVLE